MTTQPITTQKQITDLMQPDGPAAIIDFWASWCGPCRAMAPHFEEASRLMDEQDISFYKLDTEAHPDLAKAFNIRSLPTVLAIKDGQIQDVLVGMRDARSLTNFAKKLLGDAPKKSLISRLLGT